MPQATTQPITAVLVIDMQQGLCEGEGAAHDCEGTIARINLVTRQARSVGALVVFVQHESGAGYLEHGTAAWQLAHGLEVAPSDARVRKTTPDAFLNTALLALLRTHGVSQLVVCGMHTEFCVDTTTRRALALGYPVVLVADGHTSAGNAAIGPAQVVAHHNATLTHISSFGPRVTAVAAADLDMRATPPEPHAPGAARPAALVPSGTAELVVRPLRPTDLAAWRAMWDGYNAFYGRHGATALAEPITAQTWARLLDEHEPVHARVAERDGQLVGLVHWVFHRSTSRLADVCYLQDLFTHPEVRGQGVGRALIQAVYAKAQEAGASRVYWTTHETNIPGRLLYDQVGQHAGFIVYNRELPLG